MMPRLPLVAVVTAVLLLSACASAIDVSGAERVDVPTTVPASDLALAAEGVVLEQGFTVEIDCGSDDVPLEVGSSVDCTAFDPTTEQTGGYTVTITAVDGVDYEIEVVGSESTPQPEPEAALESAQAFADLTAQAIADALGEEPLVDCGTADIEIFTGQEVRCAYETSSASGFVIATVTSFDGSFYEIAVEEE